MNHQAAPNDEGPTVAGSSLQGTTENEHLDCANDDALVKVRASLTAKLALLGYSLHQLSGGGYLVSRWDRTRHLNDLHAVSAFLRQVGGAK